MIRLKLLIIGSVVFGAFFASFPNSESFLDNEDTTSYEKLCDEVIGTFSSHYPIQESVN